MKRVQVQLTEDQHRNLRQRATATGVSIAAVVREAVDGLLAEPDKPTREELFRRSLDVAGKYRSGYTDIAENHDEYLAEIYAE